MYIRIPKDYFRGIPEITETGVSFSPFINIYKNMINKKTNIPISYHSTIKDIFLILL